MNIKVMEWNLNFKANRNAKLACFIKDIIKEYDIIIFTEVVINDSVIQLMNELGEYNFFESYNNIGNQIVIAIRRTIKVTHVITKIPNTSLYNTPNFLHVEIMLNEVKYQIIGVRIRIEDGSDNDYKERRKQAEVFANYISDKENVVVLGDFNNSYICGDMDEEYIWVKKRYETPKKDGTLRSTRFYCYQMMREIMSENIKIYTPRDKFSWGLEYDNGNFKYGYIKNDHILASKNLTLEMVDYNWDFVSNNMTDYEEEIRNGFPDHAIISAEIKL